MNKRQKKRIFFSFNFYPKNQRGISAVVTTLIIILLALVAIGIVWVVIRNIISEGVEEISFERFYFDLSIKNAYIDSQDVKVGVRRSPGGGDLIGVEFIFYDGTNSFLIEKKIPLKELEERTFTFNSTEVGGIGKVETVSIAPIYESAGKETIGDITDTAEIRSSPPLGVGAVCGNSICESGEDSINCPQDCSGAGAVCGNNIIEGTEQCDDGNTDSGDGCSSTCQSEGAPSSCDGAWDQSDIDDGNQCDGGGAPGNVPNCLATCICAAGYIADGSGGCMIEPSLNTGTIDSVWPIGAGKYFDSNGLPKDSVIINSYKGKYANFSRTGGGGETRCLWISYAEYLSDPAYNKSYVRVELVASIMAGDVYEIWTSSICGA
ncbi:MAG TPA: hypothetical protein ENI22_00770 [Candidatus Pacearchaeota archaeon]|nr:hypothetical protein [Candidatus Pacearchaeota archaeon]